MFLLKLAFLNIGRNVRRSVITVLAIAVGLGSLIFLWGFHDGTSEQMRENVIRLFTGHVQIHEAGFEKTIAPELFITDREKVLKKVRAHPKVVAISERVKCEALVGTSERSRGVLLIGLDPVREPLVTELQEHLQKGEFLSPGDDRALLLGSRLADKLKVDLGNKVVVMTQAMDGTLAGYAYRVKGLVHTGSQQIDELAAYISLASGRELLDIGNQTHEIVIRLKDRKDIPEFMQFIVDELDASKYEILPWNIIIPEPEMWVQWYDAIMDVILICVMIIIGVGIMNTILMSVYERTRELGVMMAIGTRPSQMVSLILFETIILELFGIILGVIGGCAVVFYFGQVGISFHDLEQALSQSYVSTVTYTRVEFSHIIQSILTLMVLTTGICIYPALKVGRMEPVKAIYHS